MHKHLHHIIPRHMGGTDDPSNLIELTIEEHADAHRKLYEQHGKREDYLAWKGLSGKIGKEEIMVELASLGGKKGAATCKELKKGAFYGSCPEISSKAGSISTNKDSSWWYNGKDYKFCIERPDGYEKSAAPNNPGKKTSGTKWWNNGVKHKRSAECPGEGWLEGRINNGELGGARKQTEAANTKRSQALKEHWEKKRKGIL